MDKISEWVQFSEFDNPEVGMRIKRSEPLVDTVFEGGSGFSGPVPGIENLTGVVTEVGAHFSDALTGRSGWHCRVEYDLPGYAAFCEENNYTPGSSDSVIAFGRSQLPRNLAEQVAAEYGRDGKVFTRPETEEDIRDRCLRLGAVRKYYVRWEGVSKFSPLSKGHVWGDPIRFDFEDGSAILITANEWSVEVV